MNSHNRHPDEREDDDLHRLAEVFQNHTPADPSDQQWSHVLQGIRSGLEGTRTPPRPWRWLAMAGIVLFLCLGLGLIVRVMPTGRPASPVVILPPGDEGDAPFPVASAGEVYVLDVSVDDADRLAVGQRLMGAFEVATRDEIEVHSVEPDPDDGRMPVLASNAAVPLIVVSGEAP